MPPRYGRRVASRRRPQRCRPAWSRDSCQCPWRWPRRRPRRPRGRPQARAPSCCRITSAPSRPLGPTRRTRPSARTRRWQQPASNPCLRARSDDECCVEDCDAASDTRIVPVSLTRCVDQLRTSCLHYLEPDGRRRSFLFTRTLLEPLRHCIAVHCRACPQFVSRSGRQPAPTSQHCATLPPRHRSNAISYM